MPTIPMILGEPKLPVYPLYIPEACILYMDFQETGGNKILDHSGKVNHGTNNGSISAFAPNGYARLFDGNDTVTVTGDILGTGQLTIESWVNLTGYGAVSSRVIDNGKALLGFNGGLGNVAIFSSDGGATTPLPISAANSIPLNVWKHVVVVRYATALVTFFVDGQVSGAENQAAGGVAAGGNTLVGNNSGGARGLLGRIGLLRVYNRALTKAEILERYQENAERFGHTF